MGNKTRYEFNRAVDISLTLVEEGKKTERETYKDQSYETRFNLMVARMKLMSPPLVHQIHTNITERYIIKIDIRLVSHVWLFLSHG